MKNKFIVSVVLLFSLASTAGASFLYQETDPYCTISGTTHTSFPGEISDTSSWSIPTAYESVCDKTPKLSESEKERINTIMISFFRDNNFIGPIYGGTHTDAYGGENTLNPNGQNFVNTVFFPTVIEYINKERAKSNPNMTNVAVLNQAVKTIGYDYFLWNN